MNKAQALYKFWSSFEIPAIDEQSSYDTDTLEELNITYPYISYETAIGSIDEPLLLGADIWDRSTSWAAVELKAEEIASQIGGGFSQHYSDGCLWITKGQPFSQRMPTDKDIRRIHININAEFLSA